MPTPSNAPSHDIQSWYHEAEKARQVGDIATAQAAVERILEQDPGRPGALYLRGLLALDSNQFEAAQSWLERAIEIHPHADFYTTLCVIQIKQKAYGSALQTARQGLALQPDSIKLRYYEAGTLFVQGFLEEAAVSYRKLLELEPDNVQARANLGVVAKDLGALDEAERHLRHAVALAPGYLSARGHLGPVLLATGRYEEAWPWHEDRWANFVTADGCPSSAARPQVPLPQWRGECPESAIRAEDSRARGARLLVIPEQGHGDSLQFVRYLPLALERFSQVGYICPPSLRRLYEESLCSCWPGLVLLDDGLSGFDDWDWHCPMMSLPMAFGTRLDNIPAARPYLYPDPARPASWRARLAALPNPDLPRVGVVWAGGHSGMMEDKVRSLTPAQIAPLLALPHIRWISLQKTDDPAKRTDAASQAKLTDWMDEITDFADTAALIENLDQVIAVDTSVAHLAAAMGKPVWLFNRFAGCWRWLRDRDDSPWCPTVRLFTQTQRGNWDDVLTRVATALQQRFVLQDGRRVSRTTSTLPASSSEDIPSWYAKAHEAYQTGQLSTAQTLLDQLLARQTNHPDALHLRGLVALASDEIESARHWVERAIEAQAHPLFYNTLCVIQGTVRAFSAAAQSAQRGLALQPDWPVLYYNLGYALQQQDRLTEAAVSYRRTLELDSDHSAAHNNLGTVTKALGAFDEAERHYRHAIALAPGNLEARSNLGHILLTVGRYEEAWPYFENRWASFKGDNEHQPAPVQPESLQQWKGEDPHAVSRADGAAAKETSLIVIHEQGFGDSLQFVRYLPLVLKRFSRVGYFCPPPLRRLYEQSLCSRWPGLVLLDSATVDAEDWDWACPLMSLPMAFGTRLDTIPVAVPYLYAEAERAMWWRAKLAALPAPERPCVGVVWAGGHSSFSADGLRSLSFRQIEPLLGLSNVRWISLQKTDDPAKRPDSASKAGLTDWTDEITDFADTAALIENLYLVISVDTSVAHLAAAMGKPVWLLNRFAGCWRWLRDRDDSPWYPSLRLFNQSQRGNWDDVFARVASELKHGLSTHAGRIDAPGA